jgi:Lon protease-like protein
MVLFPGALVPLHIFEPRYRQLLSDLSAGPARFGILPPGEDGGLPPPGVIGCEAEIRGVQPLPDGRSNIVVSGERRFRLLAPHPAPTPYAQGRVEWVEDLPDVQIPAEADLDRLRALGARYAQALDTLNDQVFDRTLETAAGPGPLSFAIAALLEWEFAERQRLLETRSATERVVRLLHALPALVASAERRARAHQAAQSNGHGIPA